MIPYLLKRSKYTLPDWHIMCLVLLSDVWFTRKRRNVTTMIWRYFHAMTLLPCYDVTIMAWHHEPDVTLLSLCDVTTIVRQLPYSQDVYNIKSYHTQLLAFCDTFNHTMCLNTSLISYVLFYYFHLFPFLCLLWYLEDDEWSC